MSSKLHHLHLHHESFVNFLVTGAEGEKITEEIIADCNKNYLKKRLKLHFKVMEWGC